MLDLSSIDKSWTLFLDRDGVINHEKRESYIFNVDEFTFYDGVLDAMKIFHERFNLIVLVTNQRGIGKGLMTESDLHSIHTHMLAHIQQAGGHIERIYFAPDFDKESFNRKPNPGMAHRAKADFPHIDFTKSIMVGNKPSDMLFGRNAGMHTVYLATTNPETPYPHVDIDARYNTLLDFAQALTH
ncbi:MAG: HAD-IIIA family hydrolase [Filimonas sp.]|nr:HAD-IIIA family hydrolase [Filimonas sp.]